MGPDYNWCSQCGRDDRSLSVLTQVEARRIWQDRVRSKAGRVDPDNSHDWETLCFGFLLGLGYWSIVECEKMTAAFLKEGLL